MWRNAMSWGDLGGGGLGGDFGGRLWLWVFSEHLVAVSRGWAGSAEGDLGLYSIVGTWVRGCVISREKKDQTHPGFAGLSPKSPPSSPPRRPCPPPPRQWGSGGDGDWSLRKVEMRVSYGEMSEMLCWISIPPSQKNKSIRFVILHPPRGTFTHPPRSEKKKKKKKPTVLPNTKAETPAATPRENAEENENICNILFQIALKKGGSVGFLFVLCLFSVDVVSFFSACSL